MQEAIAQIRSHDTHKLLSAKAAFLRRFKFLGSFSAALSARPLVFFHR